ncbi:MAG: alpha/beta fold hydrolase [Verrucomicrobiales bacterium]|nr:alpha/beta fold hydrolase [Verrucomicrobiales bacterium]
MLKSHFIPAAQPGSHRLFVMMHGLGDSHAGYLWLPDALGLPWLNYLLPDAPDEYFGGYSWYDFAGNPQPGVRRSTKLLFELLDEQRAKGFPSEQIVLGGFSQGGLMALEAGLRYPHKLAGIICISGYVADLDSLLRELSPVAKQQRVLVTHGVFDPLIPFDMVKRQVAQLKKAGLDVRWHDFPKDHTIAGETELELLRGFLRVCFDEQPTGATAQ